MSGNPYLRKYRKSLLLVLGLVLCVPLAANLSAQEPAVPMPVAAPSRPSSEEDLPPRTGFIPPPMDLSHLQAQPPGGIRAPLDVPDQFDWREYGMVTPVKNQGACGSCYAFGTLGNLESRLLILGEGEYDLSENHAKECNWDELYGGGSSCAGGNTFMLVNLFSQTGTVLESDDPYVASDVDCTVPSSYQFTVLDWRIIDNSGSVPDTELLKQYIYDFGPVVTSMYAGDGDAWAYEFGGYDGSYTLYHPGTEDPNHSVLIVGWDDGFLHTGGSGGWIVKNSWGTGWGDSGYFAIAYGSAQMGTYSSFVYDLEEYDSGGDLLHYDEGGRRSSVGWGIATAWGLAKFSAPSTTYVTHIEFWTTDATSDVDVYLYDSFDGTSLPAEPLDSILDNAWVNAGYHRVWLASPIPVQPGQEIVAVVKFTTAGYGYPVPYDNWATMETGKTFISLSGADGSWLGLDLGGLGWGDAAIRIRTSDNPTAVELASFVATPMEDSILLTWETAFESESAGFNLYRATAPDQSPERLNETLIRSPHPGSLSGSSYEYEDHGVEPGVTYYYWLEILDASGDSNRYGPVSATVADGPTHFQYLPLVFRQ
jgi:C1A family cysteine protease